MFIHLKCVENWAAAYFLRCVAHAYLVRASW